MLNDIENKNFIEKCDLEAKKAIKNFLNKLSIVVDDRFFQDQDKISVEIGEIKNEREKNGNGEYDVENDKIIINKDLFKSDYYDFNNPNVIIFFSKIIIHERLHSMRRILIKNLTINDEINCIASDIVFNGFYFEESITEALANIIAINNIEKFSNKSMNELINIAKKKLDYISDEYAMDVIKNIMDKDMIEWFMTTRYQENYENQFAKKFGENYKDLLESFNTIFYDRIEDQDYVDFESIIKLEEIINKTNNSTLKF